MFRLNMLSARHFTRLISSAVCPIRFVNMGEHFSLGCPDELKLSSPVALAGRDFLASSRMPGFPEFLAGPRENTPLYLKANNEMHFTASTWGIHSREIIDMAYKKYATDGVALAILFRGMPIQNVGDYSDWLDALNLEKVPYFEPTGLTPKIDEFVTTGSTEASDYNIEPHNERSFLPSYPDLFTMCMFRKPASGGQTAVVDNRETLRKLDGRFMEKCERKQFRYWRFLADANGSHPSKKYKSWQQHFCTENKAEVEAELKDSFFNFEWHDGNLVLWHNRQAFIQHRKTGERLWFNQAAAGHCSYLQSMPMFQNVHVPNKEYPFHCTYGDGEEIETECLAELRRIKWENAVGFEWQEGDILVLDNLIMQHSRLSFQGERQVGISFLNMD